MKSPSHLNSEGHELPPKDNDPGGWGGGGVQWPSSGVGGGAHEPLEPAVMVAGMNALWSSL